MAGASLSALFEATEAVLARGIDEALDEDIESEELNDLVNGAIAHTLVRLHAFASPGSESTSAEIVSANGLTAPNVAKVLDRWMARLVTSGDLEVSGEHSFRAPKRLEEPDLGAMLVRARMAHPHASPVLAFVERCAREAVEFMREEVTAFDLYLPDGSRELTDFLYSESKTARLFNSAIGEALRATIKELGGEAKREIAILEIGAGSGGTTTSIVPVASETCNAANVPFAYTYTDVSMYFAPKVKKRLAAFPEVQYRKLDLEADSLAQGFVAHTFDVIVAANVVHTTRDVVASMRNIASLLRPGGFVIVWELSSSRSWFDVTLGLLDGWNRHDDRFRRESPLLSASVWKEVFSAADFENVLALGGESASASQSLGQAILIGRTTAVTS